MPSRWGPLMMPTSEERALLRLLAAGKTFSESARVLNLPPVRIEANLRDLQARLHLTRRALLVHATLRGWL